jgi:hypothetical protein
LENESAMQKITKGGRLESESAMQKIRKGGRKC